MYLRRNRGGTLNPLARYSLMAQGEQVHISTWPAIWPTRKPSSGGNYDLAGAVRIRAGAHSFEAKAFGVVCAGFLSREMHDFLVDTDPSVAEILEGTPRAASLFITPTGEPFGDSLQNDEGILYGHIDINQCVEPKQFHDVVGSYNRFDIFKLTVDRSPHRPAVFLDDTGTREGHGSATGLISSTIPDDGVELIGGKDENQL